MQGIPEKIYWSKVPATKRQLKQEEAPVEEVSEAAAAADKDQKEATEPEVLATEVEIES